ncbi:uncharacterized protein NPIL_273551 [Nephila pilipes]|uniref:Uncharacterized protein n=1 Tax=Nephila pilipes TaxID=299642 RepID=A0A8X6U690_NEPPI|nr:uncharacterized protein NPIL_273551 [Nephila pilipes]
MSVNTARNQLDYIDLFINGKKVKCLKYSDRELIILNMALFPEKPSTGSTQIKSCFGNIVEVQTASFNVSLNGNEYLELTTTISQQFVNATKKKQDSLSSLYNKLSTQLRALSSLGVTTDQCGVILYPLVESSLPSHILRSFERQRKNIDTEKSISTLDAIVSFLKSEVQSEEKIKLSRSEILPYERECKHLTESQSTLPSAAELFIQESNDTCAFCFKAHANRFCKRAFFIPLEEKIAIIKKKGLCRVSLAKGHLASRCRSQITCQLCSIRHLKFMCPNIVCNKSDSPKQEIIAVYFKIWQTRAKCLNSTDILREIVVVYSNAVRSPLVWIDEERPLQSEFSNR